MVAFDAFSSSTQGTTNRSWTHTPVAVSQAICVIVNQDGASTDQVSNVSYGGVNLVRVAFLAQSSGKKSAVYVYHLGSSIPTGAQTVTVTVSGNANKQGGAYGCTALGNTIVDVANTLASAGTTNPSLSLAVPIKYQGMGSCVLGGWMSGDPTTAEVTSGPGFTTNLKVAFGSNNVGVWQHKMDSSAGATETFDGTSVLTKPQGMACTVISELAAISIPVTTASFGESGKTAPLIDAKKINAAATPYSLTRYGNILHQWLLSPDSVAYAWTGNDADVKQKNKIAVVTGAYVSNYIDINPLRSRVMPGSVTPYSYTANPQGITHQRPFQALTGLYSLSMTPESIRHTNILTVAFGAFTETFTGMGFAFVPRWELKKIVGTGATRDLSFTACQASLNAFLAARRIDNLSPDVPVNIETVQITTGGVITFSTSASFMFKELNP